MPLLARTLLLILSALTLYLSYYLFTHRTRPLLLWHPERNATLHGTITIFAVLLLLDGAALALCTWLNLLLAAVVLMIAAAFLAFCLSILAYLFMLLNH